MATLTYSWLKENFAKVWDRVERSGEPIIVERRGHRDIAILPADRLGNIREMAHLLGSPRNATRLVEALVRANAGEDPIALSPTELRMKVVDGIA